MSQPRRIFSLNDPDRTADGDLTAKAVEEIKKCLDKKGFVLVPSDTAYAIATYAKGEDLQDRINQLLERKQMPISVVCPNIQRMRDWVHVNEITEVLLKKFTPGPITLVCKARLDNKASEPVRSQNPKALTDKVLQSKANTIGIRIPDSKVELTVAGCSDHLTTTVPVKEKDGSVVTDFTRAIEIVAEGMDRIGATEWIAIEGSGFRAKLSTVVYITDVNSVSIIREGDIDIEDIMATVEQHLPLNGLEREAKKKVSEGLDELDKVLAQSEKFAAGSARFMLNSGLLAVPTLVLLGFGLMVFDWASGMEAKYVVATLSGLLTALMGYTFFIFRIMQQFSFAAERLTEKRIAIHFLRFSTSLSDPKNSALWLKAGEKMFLGHHTPETLPLQPEDRSGSASGSHEKKKKQEG